jgi:osmotically-inducible protein OsmY
VTVEMKPSTKSTVADDRVHESVRRRIDGCSYEFIFDKVTWHCHDGHLTLRGCVPSFHRKQQLQELLRGIERVTQITNSLDVASSTGVSSARSHRPK